MLIFKGSQVIKYYVMFAFLFVQTVELYSNESMESNQKLNLFLLFSFEPENKIKHLDYQVSFGDIGQQLKAGMLNLRYF